MNQIAEQKPAVENSDKQTKVSAVEYKESHALFCPSSGQVSELFDVVKQWDAVASTLPDLVLIIYQTTRQCRLA